MRRTGGDRKVKALKRQRFRDILLAGLALFAMFLGAGNIIFPPFAGVQAGSKWLVVALGFLITAAGLPLLGTFAVARLDGNSNRLCDRAWPVMGKVLNITIIIMIGPLFAIPRTAATTFEMSVLPFLPEAWPKPLLFIACSALFFLVTLALSLSEGKVMDTIGGILSPLLILFLFVTIALSILKPVGAPMETALEGSHFYYGFSSGYQTMDGIGSLVLSGTVASLLLRKGYSKQEAGRMMLPTALISGVLLAAVYLGYVWIGASAGSQLQGLSSRTAMLGQAAYLLAGPYGQMLLAAIILFACLTTSSGLVVTFANYFHGLLKGRVSYRALVILCTLVSFGISLIGVEGIISLAAPVLALIYPVCIMLILLNLLSRFIKRDGAIRGALIGTLSVMPLMLLCSIPATKALGDRLMGYLPLGDAGFGYLLPAALGFVIGHFTAPRNRLHPVHSLEPKQKGKQAEAA